MRTRGDARPALDPEMRAPKYPGKTLLERFLSKVEFSQDGHWLWVGAKQRKYGVLWVYRRGRSGNCIVDRAHEASYRMFRGAVPAGFRLMPCRTTLCVHPDHILCLPEGAGRPSAAIAEKAPMLRREFRRRKRQEVVMQDLATEFGVTREAIRLVLVGRIKGMAGKLTGKADEIRARYTGAVSASAVGRELSIKPDTARRIIACRSYRL